MTHKRFRNYNGQVYDTKRAVVCPDSGAVVVKDKGGRKMSRKAAEQDAAFEPFRVLLDERRRELGIERTVTTWDDDVPF